MKNILIYVCLATSILFYSCSKKAGKDETSSKSISISEEKEGAYLFTEKKVYSFGKVYKSASSKLTIDIGIVNKGNKPLFLYKSDVSCGCLTIILPKEPIQINQNGSIRVNIDISKQNGVFNKSFFIKSNAVNNIKRITIKGNVI